VNCHHQPDSGKQFLGVPSMNSLASFLVAVWFGLAMGASAAQAAGHDVSGAWTASFTGSASGTCSWEIVQTGTNLTITGSCDFAGSVNFFGAINPDTGAFSASGPTAALCGTATINGIASPETDSMSGTYNCAGYGGTFTGVRLVAPSIVNQPTNQTILAGANVNFSVTFTGTAPLNYQWRKNGVNIVGETSSTLTLNSVTAANSGSYSVVVWNAYGSVTSATAYLAVLTDGANGNKPSQISVPQSPTQPINVDSLVIVTHGWDALNLFNPNWITNMATSIQARVPNNWVVVTLNWADPLLNLTEGINPQAALGAGTIIGLLYGHKLAQNNWKQVHLISHSAGAAVIQAIADQLKSSPNPPVVQTTFLDPFLGLDFRGLSWYGNNAAWSDDYFTPVDEFSVWTGLPLPKAYAVDVSWVGPHQSARYIGPNGGEVALSSHRYPIDFYMETITNIDANWCGTGYGFALSEEKEGVSWNNNQANDPVGSGPILLCSPPDANQNPYSGLAGIESVVHGDLIFVGDVAHEVSDIGASLVGDAGFVLNSIWSALPLVQSGGIRPLGGPASPNVPAWLAVGVTITNAVNFVQFDAGFTDTNAAEGLLTVYWNTNQIGMVDERVAEANLQTYRLALPGMVTSGIYTLSFRLDSFDNSSSIAVTNVATGFVGVAQPIALGILLTNGAPLVQLTAATNFTYLIQSSTNLVDWTPTALLLNTNGTAQFIDSAVTNSSARFYRAVMP
jgi:Immunoglobulin domain